MEPDYYKLTIPNPCANDWDAMMPAGSGRFCASCNQKVIDFTNQSESQIKAYVTSHAGEKMCGRFYKSQIDRIRIEFEKDILHSDIHFWQKFLVVLLVCFGSEVLGIDFCLAQDQLPDSSIVQTDSVQQVCDDTLMAEIPQDSVLPSPVVPLETFTVNPLLFGDMLIMGGFVSEVHYPGINLSQLEIFSLPEEVTMENKQVVKSAAVPANLSPLRFSVPIQPVKPRKTHQDEQQNLFVSDTGSQKRKRRKKLPLKNDNE